jgi:hypothetical protein
MRAGPFGAEFVNEEAREMKRIRRGLDDVSSKGNPASNTTIDFEFVTRQFKRKSIIEKITYSPPGGIKPAGEREDRSQVRQLTSGW